MIMALRLPEGATIVSCLKLVVVLVVVVVVVLVVVIACKKGQ